MKIQKDEASQEVFLLEIHRPSNFHAHFRRDALMHAVAPIIMQHQRYVLAMPNNGPIVDMCQALAYHYELRKIADTIGHEIDILMTLYLTRQTTTEMIEQMANSKIVRAIKYYPPHPGATTGSGHGVPLDQCGDILRAMEVEGVPLLGHFESTHDAHGREIPHELREGYMVDNDLWRLRDTYPKLQICFEHASTRKAVEFVEADTSGNTVMTVTPQHSLFTRDDFPEFGPDLKCMPIVKTLEDREAIVEFMTSGDARVIAGDDTAPHLSRAKHQVPFETAANGCWLPHAIGLYATVFSKVGALDGRFENFMSLNGPTWWNLPYPTDTITLVRDGAGLPGPVAVEGTTDVIVPLGWKEGAEALRVEYSVVD